MSDYVESATASTSESDYNDFNDCMIMEPDDWNESNMQLDFLGVNGNDLMFKIQFPAETPFNRCSCSDDIITLDMNGDGDAGTEYVIANMVDNFDSREWNFEMDVNTYSGETLERQWKWKFSKKMSK